MYFDVRVVYRCVYTCAGREDRVDWTFEGGQLPPGCEARRNELHIPSPTTGVHDGLYQCTVWSGGRSSSAYSRVTIYGEYLVVASLCAPSLYVGSLYDGSLLDGSLYVGNLYVGSLYVGSLHVGSLYVGSLYDDSLYVGSLCVGSVYLILVCMSEFCLSVV